MTDQTEKRILDEKWRSAEAETRAEMLSAQVQKLEEENNRLDEKIFLLDQENKLNVAERDEWRSKYEHTLANSVIVED